MASRRSADTLIAEGKVAVNGEVITKLGHVIDESKDVVLVNGVTCRPPQTNAYVAMNKPKGYLVTLKDEFGRKTIQRLMVGLTQRVYPVGRLDLDSEGLLLLTDDGELAFRLAHPSYGIKKLYTVRVKGAFSQEHLRFFFDGITLEDGHVAHAKAKIIDSDANSTFLSIELQEGRKREIRRMCKTIGYPVISLVRVKFDDITLQGIDKGKWRYLLPVEVERLKRKVGMI